MVIIDRLYFIEIKNFYSAKANVKRVDTLATEWKKYLQKIHVIKDFHPKYTNNFSSSTIRK